MNEFQKEVAARIAAFPTESEMCQSAEAFIRASTKPKYSYNFSFLGRPIIQYPQDMVAIQELIWSVKPDLIIETGVAHGGSLIMSAAMLALLDYCDAVSAQTPLNPLASRRQVLGVDIEIRAHNRAAITAHPMAHKIKMLEGSSLDSGIIRNVSKIAGNYARIMVLLDSNHTCDHVFGELQAYAPLTSIGSYCVVFDTIVDKMPGNMYPDRPWGPGNGPLTAIQKYMDYLQKSKRKGADGRLLKFVADHNIDNKLLISVAPGGFLQRV